MSKYYLTDEQMIINFIKGYKKNLKQVIKDNQVNGYLIIDNYTYIFTPYLALKYEFNNSAVNDINIKAFIKDVFNDIEGVKRGLNAVSIDDNFINNVKHFFTKNDKINLVRTVLYTTKNAVISNNKVLVKAITDDEKITAYIDRDLLILPDNTRLASFTNKDYLTDTIKAPLLYEDGSSFFSIVFTPVNYKND